MDRESPPWLGSLRWAERRDGAWVTTEQTEQAGQWSASNRKPARRRRVAGGRQHRHVVRVTPEEEARLLVLAGEYRVSVAKLLVDSALAAGTRDSAAPASPAGAGSAGPVDRAVAVELFAAVRQLAGVATNVNQIARKANTTGEVAAETPATLRAVRECAASIEALLRRMSVAGT